MACLKRTSGCTIHVPWWPQQTSGQLLTQSLNADFRSLGQVLPDPSPSWSQRTSDHLGRPRAHLWDGPPWVPEPPLRVDYLCWEEGGVACNIPTHPPTRFQSRTKHSRSHTLSPTGQYVCLSRRRPLMGALQPTGSRQGQAAALFFPPGGGGKGLALFWFWE